MAQVRPWLDKVDKIREVLGNENDVDISLPTIVVIGDQSSGKSSVLESISGVNLPKGGGCVTKCPLIMQLRTSQGEEYADIRTANEQLGEETKIDDLSTIADHIKRKSDELTSGVCKISAQPIYLRVYKDEMPDLTLVDLPGLYYGDNMASFIKSMYDTQIKNSNSIILYVTAASTDLTTGQSLEIARSHDPEIQRTLTIVTKVDRREASIFRKNLSEVNTGLGAILVRTGHKKRQTKICHSVNYLNARKMYLMKAIFFRQLVNAKAYQILSPNL